MSSDTTHEARSASVLVGFQENRGGCAAVGDDVSAASGEPATHKLVRTAEAYRAFRGSVDGKRAQAVEGSAFSALEAIQDAMKDSAGWPCRDNFVNLRDMIDAFLSEVDGSIQSRDLTSQCRWR